MMNKIEKEEFNKILSLNGINLFKKDTTINGKLYKRKDVYSMTSSFTIFNKDNIISRFPKITSRIDIIYYIFLLNVSKYTFLGLILPCVVFLIISLISFSLWLFCQDKGNLSFTHLNGMQINFLLFLGIMFLIFNLILLIKIVWLKEKIVYTRINGQKRYSHITNNEYKEKIEIFKYYISNKYIYFKNIDSDRLTIREFKQSDIKDVYEYVSNDEVNKYMTSNTIYNIDDCIDYIQNCLINYENKLIYKLAIFEKNENKVIGYIGLSKKDYSIKTCQVVYALNEKYWNKGYMSEALNCFIDYLKKSGKEYIIGGHVQENVNSGKVLLKCGFKREFSRDYDLIINEKTCHILSYVLDLREENRLIEDNKENEKNEEK